MSRKASIIGLLIIALALFFLAVSCGEPTELDETVTVMYPVFMESESKDRSRGLSNMTDVSQLSPFDDTGVAQGIMSTMPCMAGIKPVVIKKSELVSSISDAFKGTVYPFGFKCIRKMIKPNLDGIYCYYDIYDGEQWVGFFDYYYNWNTRRFSYKEVVNVTVSPTEIVFVFIEYNDVAIEGFDTAKPRFAVGQLKEDGSFENNATMTQITFQESSANVQSFYVTAKSDGQLFASFFRPDEAIEFSSIGLEPDSELENMYERFDTWRSGHIYSPPYTVGDSKNFIMDDFFNVLGTEMLSDIGAIREKASLGAMGILENGYHPAGYSSYSEYRSLSLRRGRIDNHLDSVAKGRTYLEHDNASVLDFVTRKTASVQHSYKLYHRIEMGGVPSHDPLTCLYCKHTNNGGGTPTLINVTNVRSVVDSINARNLESIGLMGCTAPYDKFGQIYQLGEVDKKVTPAGDPEESGYSYAAEHSEDVMNYKIALATAHMKACGLSEPYASNYAKNLIYSEDQIEWGNGSKHYIKITAEPFETFKAMFDAAQLEP